MSPQVRRIPVPFSSAVKTELASLHRSAMPRPDGIPDAFDLACWSRPAGTIGGDLVVVRPIDETRLVLCLADVMGHGTPAAVVAAAVRAVLHQQPASALVDLGGLLGRLNQMVSDLFEGYFVTATVALLNTQAGTLTFAQAGHPALILRNALGDVTQLSTPSLPLGLVPEEVYHQHTAALDEGTAVVVYSDGVSDALRSPRVPGTVALAHVVGACRHPEAFRLVQRIRRTVRRIAPVRHDDRSVLVVRRQAS